MIKIAKSQEGFFMATLQKLVQSIQLPAVVHQVWQTVAHLEFQQLVVDSRQVQQGDVFILLKSQNPNEQPNDQKLSNYLSQVAEKAVFVLSEIDVSNIVSQFSLPIVYVANIRDFLGDLIQANLQSQQIVSLPIVIATTGTNGKTTISQLVAQLMNFIGKKTAVMGTAGNGILPNLVPATHTTLEVFNLHRVMYDYAHQNVEILSIEASSHGLHQQRLQGVPIKVAIFSNLSRDHLDYHHDMDDYATTKAKLFNKNLFPQLTHAIINLDDEYSQMFIEQATTSALTVWTYSLVNPKADFFAKEILPSLDGVALTLTTPQGEISVKSPLLGRFNVANLLASIGAVLALGVSLETIQHSIAKLQGASGRMERVPSKVASFIVDYAHTPDAVEQVLVSLKNHCTGDLWVIFGCGGDRDRGKRPLMTQSALKYANKIILTADNPRTENPMNILNDMQQGLSCDDHYKIDIEPDRKQAIELAVKNAKENDIVAILGKGHETYQEINGVRYDFDDREVVKQMIEQFHK